MENNNLNVLSILHIIKGILSILTGLVIGFFFGLGSSALSQQNIPQDDIPFNPIHIISGMGIFFFILCLALGVINLLAAKYIKERRNHTFIFVVAVFNCLSGILGLALGIFTLVEIQKKDIKQLFVGNTV